MSEINVPVAGDAHPDLEHHPGEHASDKQFIKVFIGLPQETAFMGTAFTLCCNTPLGVTSKLFRARLFMTLFATYQSTKN